ncbi:hypothetical protein LOTGIDRAFT_158030 [Lottia gigantea]|uniref:ATP synthase F(1) complex subunit delta, mitochondrial n=1 Tax=Lottia gigantea TaxID=225164 RepID=V4A9S2_LOTGI|nr:hypothetical protein LOTGIDRAFT_158030 [Lottia gigantea]ESP00739.1 hypothetical protein LOTGIDRAFT_158030 [Lottia gigantea]
MSFTFASPSNVYYTEAEVKQVDVPGITSMMGIFANHVPCLSVLKPGVVTVTESDSVVKRFFVSSGSVTINDDSSVQVLAEEAHPLENFDAGAVRDGLAKAQSAMSSASTEQQKAEAQIAVECYEALSKAI